MSFHPDRGANQVVTPAAGAASISLRADAKIVRLCNVGANICHVRIGTAAVITAGAASTADLPVPAGASVTVRKADGEDTLSHISAAGTTLHVQTGEEW